MCAGPIGVPTLVAEPIWICANFVDSRAVWNLSGDGYRAVMTERLDCVIVGAAVPAVRRSLRVLERVVNPQFLRKSAGCVEKCRRLETTVSADA